MDREKIYRLNKNGLLDKLLIIRLLNTIDIKVKYLKNNITDGIYLDNNLLATNESREFDLTDISYYDLNEFIHFHKTDLGKYIIDLNNLLNNSSSSSKLGIALDINNKSDVEFLIRELTKVNGKI